MMRKAYLDKLIAIGQSDEPSRSDSDAMDYVNQQATLGDSFSERCAQQFEEESK